MLIIRAMQARSGRAGQLPTASGRSGAPTGARNRFTNTKSLSAAAATPHPLELVAVVRLHDQESSGTTRCRRDFAHARCSIGPVDRRAVQERQE